MEGSIESDSVLVVICCGPHDHSLRCDRRMTMAQVRDAWHAAAGTLASVAFYTPDRRCLPDSYTVSQALLENTSHRILELHAYPRSTYWIQLYGYEHSLAPFEVVDFSTPATVGREIEETVGIVSDDYRISLDDVPLDRDQPFNAQGLSEGASLTVDLRLTVNVDLEQPEGMERRTLSCFGSQTVGDLHLQLGLQDDTVLVATSPYRRVLSDPLHLCHIVSDVMDLHVPLDLIAEKKVLISFEPITLPHRRQQVPVALSSTPLDLYEMLTDLFELKIEFQLTVAGGALEKYQSLIEQHVNSDTIIQIDILRQCKVTDQWADLQEIRYNDEVYLYSTESPQGLFLRDFSNHQTLICEGVTLTIFGSMLDIFGAVTGQNKSLLLVDRDIERSLSVQSFDCITQKHAWARSLLIDVVPMSRGLQPKEVMSFGSLVAAKKSLKQLCLAGDSLITVNPLKVVISKDKRLRLHRFAHSSTHGDVLARMRQLNGSWDVGLKARGRSIMDEEINSKTDLKFYLLANESRFQTRLSVSLNGESYGCWFEPDRVHFEDIIISIGKQADISPRTLLSKNLYCRGCGRKISKEEEEFQTVPSDCCRVRSLKLTDRKAKGTQTAVPRGREKGTCTSFSEERDPCASTNSNRGRAVIQVSFQLQNDCVSTESERGRTIFQGSSQRQNACVSMKSERRRAVVHASPQLRSALPLFPPSATPLRISVKTPKGKGEEKTVSVKGSNWRAFLKLAAQKLSVSLGETPVAFCEEKIYERVGETRRAVACFDKQDGWAGFFDAEDGARVGSLPCRSLRFLRPSSRLPFAPNLQPQVFIRTSTDLLTGNPQRQLEAAPASALSDPAFVALLLGVRRGAKLFLENRCGKFINAESGKILRKDKLRIGSSKRHFILLLREGPAPPIVAQRLGFPFLLSREGQEVQEQEGAVRSVGFRQPADIERWSFVEPKECADDSDESVYEELYEEL